MIDYITLPNEKKYISDTAKRYTGWRGRHWLQENGRATAWAGAPAIIPPYSPTVALSMTKEIQLMSFDLMRHFCSVIDGNKWRILHGYKVAMNNGSQNGFNGTPHADFVNNKDISASLPRYDKMQRVFQGTFITGSLQNNRILCIPGIDAIDATKPMPSIENIIERNWYTIATCTGNPPFHFRGQWGSGCWIAYPFILDRIVTYESKYFAEWNETFLPDPITIYLQ